MALGRRNYLFFGSDRGGEAAAIIYSLLGMCKLNGVEVRGMVTRRAVENQRLAIEPGARTAALEPRNRKIILTLRPTRDAY